MNAQKNDTKRGEVEHQQTVTTSYHNVHSSLSSGDTLSVSELKKAQESNESSSFDASIQQIIEKMQSSLEVLLIMN